MRRRQFLRVGAASALAAPFVASPAIAQATPAVKWRLTSSFGKTLETMSGAVQMLCRYVAEATDNQFVIQPFSAGELAPSNQALDAVSSGTVECAFTPTAYYTPKDPTLAFGSNVPFGLNVRQQLAWWSFGGGADIVGAALKRLNVLGIPAGSTGTQMGCWFRKELTSVDDLKGLRIRIVGLGGPVLERTGAVPYKMGHADVIPALESNALDAAEFVGPQDDEKLGLVKVARFNHYPCWWESAGIIHLIINLERWQALPKAYQHILARACDASNMWTLARYDYLSPGALRRLAAEGMVLKPFPPAVMEACHKAATDCLAEIAGRSPGFKKALDSTQAFRNEHLAWEQVSDHAFDAFMLRGRV